MRGRVPRTPKDLCPKCGWDAWLRKKNTTIQGYSLVCEPCKRKKDKEWRDSHRKQRRDYGIDYNSRNRKVFGTSRKPKPIFISLARSDGNCCAICGAKPKGKRLAMDHDHKTGKIRGLLCMQCNTALGKFRDDTKLLKKAIRYLEKAK
jgi:hypothetical protein